MKSTDKFSRYRNYGSANEKSLVRIPTKLFIKPAWAGFILNL
ncbi:hypothetical protein [Leptospira borgpetersenii]|uniref:Uncharacterized protein n=2 Tax=Leptospira borgpetersenii TaxID=174 RepID=M6CDC8_LEPBO|nr:hypothetical protein [Leptospira borgpetersenii]EMJ84265.1 hypothetical protein LEP1GSC016_2923 [Leptospira borgpetersenii serovar Hardjo-bovis str. Sponselee]EMO62918.1 hypothetical protein LEP1GSC133_4276 [Leptospira borgpetersenii serovar Pomona str. 200901868]UYM85395.1 hypothetical protein MY148_03955 [Leptospira borgpetersenii]